jgi:pimeloyl-ACP methyl ester carboxylesterase
MPVFFKREGSGPPLILIHGFPMNHSVWEDFKEPLLADYTIYTPDLPGLGQSDILKDGFTLQDVARSMNTWVSDNNLQQGVLVGHSLGGYIALEMVKENPSWFTGLVLFHSTALADNADKKESRNKVLSFIEENGVTAFTTNFIGPLFKDSKHPAIPVVKALSLDAGEAGVKGYTQAMRDRPDNSNVLKLYKKPVLLMGGEHDKGIPPESLREQAAIKENISLHILRDAAHMGMYEQKEESLEILRSFLSTISGHKF